MITDHSYQESSSYDYFMSPGFTAHAKVCTADLTSRMSDRTFPPSFVSCLQSTSPSSSSATCSAAHLQCRCKCGTVHFSVEIPSSAMPLFCHCGHCRRYHASAFAALLPLDKVPEALTQAVAIRRYDEKCKSVGDLTRIFCGQCSSVIGSVPTHSSSGGTQPTCYLGLGCIVDSSIPPALALSWQEAPNHLALEDAATWWSARPSGRRPTEPPRMLRGRCACGQCAFEAASGDEFQLQHCYCNLCRQLSGSVAQTWVPVHPGGWEWKQRSSLELVRTTGHGQRHMCTVCGTTLTIVYDSQPDCLWPVAGVLDDDSLPEDLANALCRSIHICCLYMQPWFRLPADGLPRLKYAG